MFDAMTDRASGALRIGVVIIFMAQALLPVSAGPDVNARDYEDCVQVNDSLLVYSYKNYSVQTPYIERNFTFRWKWASDAPNSPETNFLLLDPNGSVLESRHLLTEYQGELVVKVPGKYKFSWWNPSIWNDITVYYDFDICHAERSVFSFPDSLLWSAIGWTTIIAIVVIVVLYVRRIRKRTRKKDMPL